MSVCVSASINNRRVRLSSTRTLADVFRIMHTHTHTHTHTKAQTDAHVRTRKPRQQRNSLSLSLSLSLILAVCSCLSRHDERLGLHGNTIQCVLGTARCCCVDAIQCLYSSFRSSLKTELSTCIIPFIVRFHLLDVGCYRALDSGFVRTNQRMDGWMDVNNKNKKWPRHGLISIVYMGVNRNVTIRKEAKRECSQARIPKPPRENLKCTFDVFFILLCSCYCRSLS